MANEEQPQVFDVGQVVRDWQGRLRIFGEHDGPNLATPAVFERILRELEALTIELEAKDAARREALFLSLCDATCVDLLRWRVRLDAYKAAAALADPDDREAIVWSVTAPLILGWHGGRTGVEETLPEGGYPEGFNTRVQHPADIATPYSIANQLEVATQWEERRQALLAEDFWSEAAKKARGAGRIVSESGATPWLVGAAIVVGATAAGAFAFGRGRRSRCPE